MLPETPVQLVTAGLFAAEWVDLSQLTTASLSARFDAPVGVWLGAWLALTLATSDRPAKAAGFW